MLVKAIIVVFLLIILYALGSAMFYLSRGQKTDEMRFVKALGWRIGLSIFLFIMLFVLFAMGWITPHGISAH